MSELTDAIKKTIEFLNQYLIDNQEYNYPTLDIIQDITIET